MATQWLRSSCNDLPPHNAFVGGYDSDGSIIYVGRSFHEGTHLPVKVIPSKRAAYVSWLGSEHSKSHYELLVGGNYAWQPCAGANIPPNAIRVNESMGGNEPLFIGRGHYGNGMVIGRIQPSHASLYGPYGGNEIKLEKYEILVYGAAAIIESMPSPGDLIKFEDHKWLHISVYANLPANAVVGGNDVDGDLIYVGRAFHEGDMLVAKFIPAKQIAFVSFRGFEIPKDHFEILCGSNLVWRHCHNHLIPEKAVVCGKTSLGQPVYIGRGHYEGSLTVGKISSVHRALFIPFKGVERRLETYEILVEEKLTPGWQVPSAPLTITTEVPCPYPIYPEIKPLELTSTCVVVPTPTSTPTPMPMPMPITNCFSTPAFSGYPTFVPAETYTGPPHHLPKPTPSTINPNNKWVSAHVGNIPGNAVYAGHDSDMSTIYVCRAFHSRELLPGKAIPGRNSAYVSFQGQEIQKTNYELLVGGHYKWVPAIKGFAVGAIQAGQTINGEPLYVGRAPYKGTLTCGKIQRSHNCLYIPFAGQEIKICYNYEILVDKNLNHRGLLSL